MRGNVLQAPSNDSAGFISGDDNKRYLFTSDDVRAGTIKIGAKVDFDIAGDRAKEIFSLEAPGTIKKAQRAYENKPSLTQLWFSLSGRAPRYDYWARGMLLCILFMIPAVIIDSVIFGPRSQEGFFGPLMLLFSAWISIVLTIKRLRDMDISPWFVLLYLVPIANLVLGIMVAFVPGTVGENQYGEDPLEARD